MTTVDELPYTTTVHERARSSLRATTCLTYVRTCCSALESAGESCGSVAPVDSQLVLEADMADDAAGVGMHSPGGAEDAAHTSRPVCVPEQPSEQCDKNLCGCCVSLVAHLAPSWCKYSVHLRRTQGYSVFLTAVLASGVAQSLFFVLGDGCHHEPQPVVCNDAGTFMDLAKISQTFWGVVLSCPMPFLVVKLFNKASIYGYRSQSEKEKIMRRWNMKERLGWIVVVAVNIIFSVFILRVMQFFSSAVIQRWIEGFFLSAVTFISESPMVRVLHFMRWTVTHFSVRGRRTW
mmetsp:Transcript_51737/g.138048  ORF Transcript_51737/g.138048 Transcript_51737/m.138048 type:complete len:291 (-) Transcript_51737:312-1184(-)